MEKFVKIKSLGAGSFGHVNLYKHKENGHKFVIKEIFLASAQITENEVLILAALRHPNIIQYYDSFIFNNNIHIVMEYALHGTLHEYIQKQEKLLTEKYILFIFTQIVMAIEYIHENQIIHRDIKSENIMLAGATGNVIKIADFGISKILSSDKTNTQIGTANYLAPEICIGLSYGFKADIWALGCVLYELCALRRMFDGPVANIIMAVTNGEIQQISNYYDPEFQKLIDWMCRYDPDERPTIIDLAKHRLILMQIFKIQVNLGRYVE